MKSYKVLKQHLLKDAEVHQKYDRLGAEFTLIQKLIDKRLQRGLTQALLAKKIGTKQSAVSRFESGTYHPTLAFLEKVADALDAKVKMTVS